jgi:hypothetical protein
LATRRSAKGAPRASEELPCALDLVELMFLRILLKIDWREKAAKRA